VVTGASRGIGRAIVQLTQEGKTQLRRLRTAWPAAVFCWDAESISPEPLLEPAKQNWITSNSARFETPSLRLAIEKKLKWPWRGDRLLRPFLVEHVVDHRTRRLS
jgi:hypothetical protein